MSFLNSWIFFALIPLYFLYKKDSKTAKSTLFMQENRSETKQGKLLFLTLAFLIVALARPVLQNSLEEEKFDAQEYIIALDASYSMQADDVQPSRYEAAKTLIKELIHSHPKDRFSLLAFTSNTLLISPPTTDGTISTMALDALDPANILTKSTELKQLFETVSKMPLQKKNLIIFSDGGDETDVDFLAARICEG